MAEFINEFDPQHGVYYIAEVGITVPWLDEPLDHGLVKKGKDEKRFNHPLIAEFEWVREHPAEAEKEIEEVEGSEEAKAFLDE